MLVCCVFMYVGVYVVHVCYCSVVEWGFFHFFFLSHDYLFGENKIYN